MRAQHRLYAELYRKKFARLAAIEWLDTGVSLYRRPQAWRRWLRDAYCKTIWHIGSWSRGRVHVPDVYNWLDITFWYRDDRALRQYIEDELYGGAIAEKGIVQRAGIQEVVESIVKYGCGNFHLLERLFAVSRAMKTFGI